jgi:hypothetical protein
MMSNPPTPGSATAANADSEAGTNMALTVCSRNDRNPVCSTTFCAADAIPETGNS